MVTMDTMINRIKNTTEGQTIDCASESKSAQTNLENARLQRDALTQQYEQVLAMQGMTLEQGLSREQEPSIDDEFSL